MSNIIGLMMLRQQRFVFRNFKTSTFVILAIIWNTRALALQYFLHAGCGAYGAPTRTLRCRE